jgi:hypothetical protein
MPETLTITDLFGSSGKDKFTADCDKDVDDGRGGQRSFPAGALLLLLLLFSSQSPFLNFFSRASR